MDNSSKKLQYLPLQRSFRYRYRYEWAGVRQGLFNAHFLESQDSLDMWLWLCSPVLVEQVLEAVG